MLRTRTSALRRSAAFSHRIVRFSDAVLSAQLRSVRQSSSLLIVFVKPLTSYTGKLNDQQARALKNALEARHYKFREVPYARFAAENGKTNVVFYESGKLVVQG